VFYERIFKILNAKRIKYLVIGGVAVNLHGFQRTTGDLDILISLDTKNVKKFVDLIKSLKWKPRVPVDVNEFSDPKKRQVWIKTKGMKVFSVYNPKKELEHIDVMTENYIDFANAYRHRKVVSDGKLKVSVVSIQDLIKLKKIAGRERDQIDIHALEQIKRLKI
jgi:predicted nucleotidyltransferase